VAQTRLLRDRLRYLRHLTLVAVESGPLARTCQPPLVAFPDSVASAVKCRDSHGVLVPPSVRLSQRADQGDEDEGSQGNQQIHEGVCEPRHPRRGGDCDSPASGESDGLAAVSSV
jgi:hypothetical protein